MAAFAGLLLPCLSCKDDSNAPYDGGFESLPNGALEFDGKLDFATTGTAGFPTGGTAQAISLWVQYPADFDAASDPQVLVSLRKDYASGVNLGIRDGQLAAWTVYANRVLVETTKLPPAGVWHHVEFVLDPGDGGGPVETLYVDGVVSATGMGTADKLTPQSSWLGTLDGMSDSFAGTIDEIRIWNVSRAASDVVLEMNGETAPDAPGLVAYFNCNAIQGSRVLDISGNGNDATLGGGSRADAPALVPSGVPLP